MTKDSVAIVYLVISSSQPRANAANLVRAAEWIDNRRTWPPARERQLNIPARHTDGRYDMERFPQERYRRFRLHDRPFALDKVARQLRYD